MKANTIGRALAACPCLGAAAIAAAGPGASAAPVQQAATATATPRPTSRALRCYGTGRNQVDRVKIPPGNPARPVNVGAGDFTLE
jgi:hypothetical protein